MFLKVGFSLWRWLNFVAFERCLEFTNRAEERSCCLVNIENGFHHSVLMS